ncbi:MAG: helix-turn-helix domain-containing protein [Patescibacteria group bacterium]
MHENALQNIGLTPNEIKIYECLIENGELSVSDISVKAQIHRRNAYDAISRLLDKGLCFQVVSKNENLYNAVDPAKIAEMLGEQQKRILEILPILKKKYKNHLSAEEALVYRGYEGQKNIWRDMLQVGADVYSIGAKAQWFDERLRPARDKFFKEANRKKIKHYLLFDYEVKTKLPNFAKNYPGKSYQFRYLPKEYSTNSIANIFGDYLITYTGIALGKMRDNTAFFVLHSKDLAESYRKWFWCLWKQSIL